MKFRKGDTVSIRGTVKHNFDPTGADPDKRVFVDIIGSHETAWMKPEDVKLVAQTFEVGDEVRWLQNAGEGLFLSGEILAISGEHAWIGMPDGIYCTRTFSAIERVEVEETDIA